MPGAKRRVIETHFKIHDGKNASRPVTLSATAHSVFSCLVLLEYQTKYEATTNRRKQGETARTGSVQRQQSNPPAPLKLAN